MFVTSDLLSVNHVFITLTVAVQVAHEPNALSVLSVYVVVAVGFTAMLVFVRFG